MLSVKDIHHIARLAKLHLEPDEEQALAGELSRVLGYIDMLGEVASSSATDVPDAMTEGRSDVVEQGLDTEVFLRNAPKTLDRFLLVPAIK